MDLATLLLSGAFRWDGRPGATPQAIAALEAAFDAPLPPDYLALLRLSDGGEAFLVGYPSYVRMWSAMQVVDDNRDRLIQASEAHFIAFGDNAGPDLVGFDTRRGAPYPVVALCNVPMDWENAMGRMPDFASFIGQLCRRA